VKGGNTATNLGDTSSKKLLGDETRKKYFNHSEQEGQHPLTGQRAPPISGGT